MNIDNNPQINLLNQWILRLNKAQVGHFMAYEKYYSYDQILGILIVLFSGVTSGLLLFNFSSIDQLKLEIITIISSLFTAIISSLKATLFMGTKAESHKSKASQYGALKRNIEKEMTDTQQDLKAYINHIEAQWAIIAGDSPVTPRKIRKKSKEILRDDKSDEEEFIQPIK